MLFDHILVAYDGSEPSAGALDKAMRIASAGQAARLTVAHVVNLQPVTIADVTFVQPDFYQQQLQEHGEAIIEKVKIVLGDTPNANVVILAVRPPKLCSITRRTTAAT